MNDQLAPLRTESDLVRDALGAAVHPIFATSFNPDRSHDACWAIRECVQNFLDDGPGKGTLDGVKIRELTKDGQTVFRIVGNWRFEQPIATALINLMTTKSEADAGGMGIGIKQAALVLARDYAGTRFRIRGSTQRKDHCWFIEYSIAKAAAINRKLSQQGIRDKVRGDWLVAQYVSKPLDRTTQDRLNTTCEYTIWTKNPKVIEALRDFLNMGVGPKNKYLANPHFTKPGILTIKWLPFQPRKTKADGLPRGRVFMQGQVWDVEIHRSHVDRWEALRGVSLAIFPSSVVEKTIERKALDSYSLKRYLASPLTKLSTNELVSQLEASEYLWTRIRPQKSRWDEDTGLLVVEAIVHTLKERGYDYGKSPFAEKRYYCISEDSGLKDEQIAEVVATEKIVVCPSFFAQLGMPDVGELISPENRITEPDVRSIKRAELAQFKENGASVATRELECHSQQDFLSLIRKELLNEWVTQTEIRASGSNQLHLVIEPRRLVVRNELRRRFVTPKNDAQKLVRAIRVVALEGLGNKQCRSVKCVVDRTAVAFNIEASDRQQAELFARTSDEQLDQSYLVLEFAGKNTFEFFKAGLGAVENQGAIHARVNSPEPKRARRFIAFIRRHTSFLMATLLLHILVIGACVMWSRQPAGDGSGGSANDAKMGRRRDVNREYERWLKSSSNRPTTKQGRRVKEVAGRQAVSGGGNAVTAKENEQQVELQRKLDRLAIHHVSNFRIVRDSTGIREQQLQLLSRYLHLCLSVEINNRLFAFEGQGASGINVPEQGSSLNGIGIHAKILDRSSFFPALAVFIHEVVHNDYRGHGHEFQHAQAALLSGVAAKIDSIAGKLRWRRQLSSRELFLAEAADKWAEFQSRGRQRQR